MLRDLIRILYSEKGIPRRKIYVWIIGSVCSVFVQKYYNMKIM